MLGKWRLLHAWQYPCTHSSLFIKVHNALAQELLKSHPREKNIDKLESSRRMSYCCPYFFAYCGSRTCTSVSKEKIYHPSKISQQKPRYKQRRRLQLVIFAFHSCTMGSMFQQEEENEVKTPNYVNLPSK